MSIMLSSLFADSIKPYDMKLIAGSGGIDRQVRWVHIIEDNEVTEFIHGNELVFTTGIRQNGTEWLVEFVTGLHRNNCAGLVVNLGPYINAVPPQVIVYCETNNFPLFTMPWNVRIIDVTFNFCHSIIRSEENEISKATAFKNLIFQPHNSEGYLSTLLRNGYNSDSRFTLVSTMCNNEEAAKQIIDTSLNEKAIKHLRFCQDNTVIFAVVNLIPEKVRELCSYIKSHDSNAAIKSFGISESLSGWESVSELFRQSVLAMKVSQIRKSSCALYSETGLYKIIFAVNDRSVLEEYTESTIGNLIRLDNKNNEGYTELFKFYLEHDSSVIETAEHFNIHRNTVNYKIRVIKKALGTAFTEGNKTALLLALYVYDINKII